MNVKFKEILDLALKTGYLISNSKINLGPLGSLLSENLKNHWLNSTINNNKDINILLNTNNSLLNTFNYAKELNGGRLPIGIAQIKECSSETSDLNEIESYFKNRSDYMLKTYIFVSPLVSEQIFYTWQTQRRIWWRKMSVLPSRYTLTDIKIENEDQSVNIKSSYEWGSHIIENITLQTNNTDIPTEELQMKDGRKKVQAHCITSTTNLFTMCLNMLCDAYDDFPFQGKKRCVFRFHRKIAPYKIGFSISNANAKDTSDLNDLAVYLCRLLRKAGFPVMFLPHFSSLESQYLHHDQLGIPYTILLKESTLKNGILYLRSRDTSLSEQVHVSNLENYIDQIYRNF